MPIFERYNDSPEKFMISAASSVFLFFVIQTLLKIMLNYDKDNKCRELTAIKKQVFFSCKVDTGFCYCANQLTGSYMTTKLAFNVLIQLTSPHN